MKKAYMLLCDDTVRDYGDEEEAAKCAAKCANLGFETVSMRDEFETIYAEGVYKTAVKEAAFLPEYRTEISAAGFISFPVLFIR